MVTHVSKHNAAKMLLLASIFVFSLNPVMAQTPFEKVKSPVNELIINGDAYIQRDMTDYVKEVASKTNPDYLHDEDENLWLNYLNRPHPTRGLVRMLSGSGTPANNVVLSSTMKIQLWLASSTANANSTISLWIDDSDGIEETAKLNIINDGAYHLYEWDLATTAYTLVTGNGSLTASTVTIDAIALRSPNGSANWSMKIDDVKAVSLGSAVFPASEAMEEQVTLGIDAEEATLSQLKVYPTLVNDYLTIEISSIMESEFEYSIFDLNGKIVDRNKLYNQRNELNLSNFKSGMYFIQIFGNQSKERFKIIKQ